MFWESLIDLHYDQRIDEISCKTLVQNINSMIFLLSCVSEVVISLLYGVISFKTQ